jgi:hypothetical protein
VSFSVDGLQPPDFARGGAKLPEVLAAYRNIPVFGRHRVRPQQELFNHFVAAGRQKMRDDLAELTRVKRVNFPKAFAHERQSSAQSSTPSR